MTRRPGHALLRPRVSRGTVDPTSGRSDVQDRATELLAVGAAGDEAYEHVRGRVQALITAARDLSDTCADLADALRPLPGQEDDGGPDFGRLRAERTAALLDEAASAARGTLRLLHSAYSALERQLGRPPVVEPVAPAPRSGVSTWPDAFVELPPRSISADEGGTADCGPEANGTVRAWAGTGDKPAVNVPEPGHGPAEPGAGTAGGSAGGGRAEVDED